MTTKRDSAGSSDALPQAFAVTIRHLAERWKDAGVLLPAFPLLARGEPLAVSRVAQVSGTPVARLERAVASGRCERDARGRLIDLYGMTLSPTLHRLEVGKKIVYSCCALWAHVIPKLVERLVRVESVDPVRRELVRLSINPQGVETVQPAGSVATMAVASHEAVRADVCSAFCRHVRHFVSRQSAEQFAAESSSRYVVELTDLQEAARELFQEIRAVLES